MQKSVCFLLAWYCNTTPPSLLYHSICHVYCSKMNDFALSICLWSTHETGLFKISTCICKFCLEIHQEYTAVSGLPKITAVPFIGICWTITSSMDFVFVSLSFLLFKLYAGNMYLENVTLSHWLSFYKWAKVSHVTCQWVKNK